MCISTHTQAYRELLELIKITNTVKRVFTVLILSTTLLIPLLFAKHLEQERNCHIMLNCFLGVAFWQRGQINTRATKPSEEELNGHFISHQILINKIFSIKYSLRQQYQSIGVTTNQLKISLKTKNDILSEK